MKNSRTVFFAMIALLGMSLMFAACKEDEHEPPDVVFKTTSGYTFGNATVGTSDSLLVGITADMTEDELATYNVSYAYDGATTTTTFQNFTIDAASEEHYTKDVTIVTRATAGTERWVFTITDRDGNIKSLEFTLTVQ